MSNKIKNFVSDIDTALEQFQQQQPLSAAQHEEREKYRKIYELRDEVKPISEEKEELI